MFPSVSYKEGSDEGRLTVIVPVVSISHPVIITISFLKNCKILNSRS